MFLSLSWHTNFFDLSSLMNLLEILSCSLRMTDKLSPNHQGTACLAPCKCIIINIAFFFRMNSKKYGFSGDEF